ncbi:hypothetical protein BDB01DRAFT_800172 [Pilobolus umbonatus]|nr:hypothetical protein BDB01DRAFT_800172 [Pilobolus umbonatus]
MTSQPSLRLSNPTTYHIMAQQSTHPLVDSDQMHYNQPSVYSRDSPLSDTVDHHDSFHANVFSQTMDYDDDMDYSRLYDRHSISSTTQPSMDVFPLDIHRRSSAATDTTLQSVQGANDPSSFNNHMFMIEPSQNLAMSAPANMGFEYDYNLHSVHPSAIPMMNSTSVVPSTYMTRSYEDDYALQMNLQIDIEKRKKRRETHNAGNSISV